MPEVLGTTSCYHQELSLAGEGEGTSTCESSGGGRRGGGEGQMVNTPDHR